MTISLSECDKEAYHDWKQKKFFKNKFFNFEIMIRRSLSSLVISQKSHHDPLGISWLWTPKPAPAYLSLDSACLSATPDAVQKRHVRIFQPTKAASVRVF
jgi:hypothetical protein